jgi:hypothetical protein
MAGEVHSSIMQVHARLSGHDWGDPAQKVSLLYGLQVLERQRKLEQVGKDPRVP